MHFLINKKGREHIYHVQGPVLGDLKMYLSPSLEFNEVGLGVSTYQLKSNNLS